jgi:hypothetical protein
MSGEQKDSLVTTVSQAKIDSSGGLAKLLAIAEEQTISLIPKTITFGTRPELILTAHLIFVNTVLGDRFFYNKDRQKVTYKEKSNGDIYLVDKESGKYALSNRKLKEIADAANITTVDLNRVGEIERDENGRINYVKYKLIWERLDIDGTLKKGVAEGFYSFQAQVDKKKKEDEKEGTTSFLDKQRGDGEKLAIANCYSRAIRDAIPQMPNTFTLEELKKPLLIPSVTKDLSKLIEKYPRIEEALLAKELGISDLMYGAKSETIFQPKPLVIPQNNADNTEIIPDPEDKKNESQNVGSPKNEKAETMQPKPTEEKLSNTASDKKAESQISNPTPQELNKITAKEFEDQTPKIRKEKIEELLKQKGKVWTGKHPIEKYNATQHIKYIEDLLNMPDTK